MLKKAKLEYLFFEMLRTHTCSPSENGSVFVSDENNQFLLHFSKHFIDKILSEELPRGEGVLDI
jgi:hypothetical protein